MTATHPLQQVLQHLHAGRWNAAHDLVQHDGSLLGAWLHGILHLQEGDLEDVQSLFAISQGSRSGHCGMGCKARCAANSSAIGKRRNAADRPQRPLPEGLERNRAIGRHGCLHGHEPMRRIRSIHSSRLRSNAIPCEIANRLCQLVRPRRPPLPQPGHAGRRDCRVRSRTGRILRTRWASSGTASIHTA